MNSPNHLGTRRLNMLPHSILQLSDHAQLLPWICNQLECTGNHPGKFCRSTSGCCTPRSGRNLDSPNILCHSQSYSRTMRKSSCSRLHPWCCCCLCSADNDLSWVPSQRSNDDPHSFLRQGLHESPAYALFLPTTMDVCTPKQIARTA